ncbi:MAG: flagellar motor switch protein FliN [Oscillospiraceae bacterium]|nr:flagellar motor switch protein FliN [Oscillospiraceae bacterium]
MSDENVVIDGFGDIEKDAIGEIMNITMGSAATAVSNMLSAKVWITTPTVSIVKAGDLTYPELEPSIRVKIEYILGVKGQNVLVLKQNDVQLILDQLMGLPLEVTDDFEFDEMNISAVCEVMNQMMGASATALSELIDTPIDISTPEAFVQKSDEDLTASVYAADPDEYVCKVKFNLTIDGVINSEFISVLTIDLAKEMASKMMAGYGAAEEPEPEPAPQPSSGGTMSQEEINALLNGTESLPKSMAEPAPEPAPSSGGMMSQEEINALLNGGAAPSPQPAPAPAPQPQAQPAAMQGMPQMQQPAGMNMNMAGVQPQMQPVNGMPYGGYAAQSPYGYGQPVMQVPPQHNPVNVQAVQLQSFDNYKNKDLTEEQNDNLQLLMGVPLNITVEIGSTKKKIKEILEFTQGTIIELERQAGAPVDVIVNGHLIAKGDVVVIDDNFAVRITEIIRSKFLDNLGKE